jgi:hypothetical protein
LAPSSKLIALVASQAESVCGGVVLLHFCSHVWVLTLDSFYMFHAKIAAQGLDDEFFGCWLAGGMWDCY